MSDLWPTDFDGDENLLPTGPVSDQAANLKKHTKGLVNAELVALESDDGNFSFDFDLIVPTLNYRFTLFGLVYGVEGYPAAIIPYSSIARELDLQYRTLFGRQRVSASVTDADDMNDLLKKIFTAESTRKIISSLMAQAKGVKGSSSV